jgi:predicted dithiol-disulfide oxidoreductase (DUF899 family)
MTTAMTSHKIVSREEWLAARAALLEREKEHPDGRRTRAAGSGASLGAGEEAVHAPDGGWPEDARGAVRRSLPALDLSLHVRPELCGRLPGEQLDRRLVRQRDPAPELFGFTAFTLEVGAVYQTYSTTGRGVEFLMPYYGFLDRAPKGRDEDGDDWQLWIRRHDEYDGA